MREGPFTKRTNRSPIFILMVVVAVLAMPSLLVGCSGPLASGPKAQPVPQGGATTGSQLAENRPPAVGVIAPDFALKDANTGQTVTLSSLRGKPVWINFWASWCPPCKLEMPDMQAAYEQYKSQSLVMLGVDIQESADTVKQFTTSHKYGWTFLLDADGHLTDRYLIQSIPTHLFVSKDGVIKAIHAGPVGKDNLKGYIEEITR